MSEVLIDFPDWPKIKHTIYWYITYDTGKWTENYYSSYVQNPCAAIYMTDDTLVTYSIWARSTQ